MSEKIRVKYILLFLALLVLFYFAGDYMLAATIRPMWREGIIPGDKETWRVNAGLLKTVPGIAGLIVSFIWGVLADKLGRPRLLFFLSLLMGAMLVLISLAYNFYYLLAVMTVFGIAKIGIGPVIYAFIPDVVPPEKRGVGYAAYYAPSVLGFVAGMIIGGILFYWRTAYLLVGLLVAIFAIPLYIYSRHVTIGYAEKRAVERKYKFGEAIRAAANRTIILMLIQILPWTIPWGFITVYSVDYITVRWGVGEKIASGILAIAAVSIALGHIIGGKLSDSRVKKGDLAARAKISVIGIGIGFFGMLGMFIYPYPYGEVSITALLPPVILALSGLMFTTFAYPNISSVISDCVRSEYRGTVFSIYNILNTIGWATGPLIYGLLVEYYMRSGVEEPTAIMYSAVGLESLWIISLIAWIIAMKTYPKDAITVKQ